MSAPRRDRGRPSSRRGQPAETKGAMRRAAAPSTPWLESPWIPVAVLALATMIFFRAVLFGGMTFGSPDTTAPLGFVKVGEETLFRQGIYPLWNPFVFCGMPSFSSLAYNPFLYPPDWPLWLVTRVLPLPSLTWLVLYYFLGGLGAYLLCREWGCGRAASTLAGLAFLSMPNLIAVGSHGHGSQLINSAILPWLLWLTARVFRRGRLLEVGFLALAIGCQLLRGHVQIAYYSWLAIGAYALFELARGGSDRPPLGGRAARFGMVLGALALGLALAAVLFLPVQEYARYSQRGGGEGGGVGMDYATSWSFHPIEILTFFVPSAVGFGGPTYWGLQPIVDYPHYMGLGVLALAVIGIARARRPWIVGFLVTVAVFGVLVALGKYGFLYGVLYDLLPQFNKFRIPVMILLLTQVATAVLAAFGIEAILEARDAEPAVRRRVSIALLAVTVLAGVILLMGLAPETWQGMLRARAQALRAAAGAPALPASNLELALGYAAGDALRVGALALVVLAAAWLTLRRTIPARALVVITGLVVVVDLWAVDARIVEPVLAPEPTIAAERRPDDVISFLMQRADSAHFRILPLEDFQSNRYAEFAVASLGGYHAAKPQLAQEYITRQAHFVPFQNLVQGGAWGGDGFLNASNTEYVLVPGMMPPGTPLEPVFQGERMIVYRNARALPRASLATAFEVVPFERQLERLTSPGFDARAAVLLASAPAQALGPPGGTVRITRYGLNAVDMETESPGPAVLRFADLYFPGWKARIDGQEAEVLRADFCFRAVVLPAGRHRVQWTYESDALRLGLILTGAAAVVILALIALGWRQRRRSA